MILVDTSALLALVEPDDRYHAPASRYVSSISPKALATHNYVAVEATSLVQRRLGDRAARELLTTWLSVLEVRWVTREIHSAAVAALLGAAKRSVSLVDYVSFELMRREGIEAAFAFDRDFLRQGFRVVP